MKLKLIPILCLALLATTCGYSEPAYNKPGYTPVNRMVAIPSEVMKTLVDLCQQCSFADIGEDYEQTDFRRDATLPLRGISWAGYSGSKWTIRYGHGGRGFHHHELTFETLPSVRIVAIEDNECNLSDLKDCCF
ncbi:hypothetical protein [Undibacterium pigrum]|uniref:Beta/gamma crystallin n=1 Tax=Undibacterium pigrum TaxID=401470 RepID=A0A318J8I4_9BURK|nr:hypothetical protein [Undibacterium pigrum]PXX43061.1 hypothetical protein DFR42_10462 [Undibacterium pigrum]